ncbi:pyrroline-5-carboxylate reductase [Bacillus sp. 1P06AnD]|uniref:pyrroline-5-carboxylate reductase n=1 Tax=Bacillus sp. 1P06AnD TaxID=3132208 RepID=UPI0039A3742B
MKLSFIGSGSMAEAMISGITAKKVVQSSSIHVINRSNPKRLSFLREQYGISPASSYQTLIQESDIIVLAVKPKDIFQALSTAKEYMSSHMLIISVAAGVSIDSISRILDMNNPIIRCMPNTSAALGRSATALAHNSLVTDRELQHALGLLQTFGNTSIVSEEQLDAVTGLSGSGPAYIYYLVEAMESSAKSIGLDQKNAKELILQTIIGAAEMLLNTSKTPQQLRKEVTSPGGTTEAGLKVLQSREVKQAFIDCIVEATNQSKVMGERLSEEIDLRLLKK